MTPEGLLQCFSHSYQGQFGVLYLQEGQLQHADPLIRELPVLPSEPWLAFFFIFSFFLEGETTAYVAHSSASILHTCDNLLKLASVTSRAPDHLYNLIMLLMETCEESGRLLLCESLSQRFKSLVVFSMNAVPEIYSHKLTVCYFFPLHVSFCGSITQR